MLCPSWLALLRPKPKTYKPLSPCIPQQVAQHLFQRLFHLNSKNEDHNLQVELADLDKGNSQKSADLLAKALNLKQKKEKLYLKIGSGFLKKS